MDDGMDWVIACDAGALEEEDVLGFDHGGRSYAVYRTRTGLYASDGLCTHERGRLADGFVIGEVIECPLHQGRFHIPSGRALGAPVCVGLRTHPVRLEGGKLLVGLPATED